MNGFATFSYDPSGNMTNRSATWIYSSGATYAYDDVNRVTQIDQGNAWNVFLTSHYQYDKASREVATWRDQQSSKGERFSYNTIGQLTGVNYNADQVWTGTPLNAASNSTYIVDSLNRTGAIYDGVYWGFQANGLNQYYGVGGVPIYYDAQFNQTTALSGATFSYDAENHLVAGSMQATYDGLGRCVRRTVGGVTQLLTYDDWKPFLEWDGSGNWKAWNIYGAGLDEILARYDSSGRISIYKQDQHGNVVAVLDQFGDVTEKYTYDAFGKPKVFDQGGNERTAGSAIGNRFMFQGREWIPDLGIYDYRHRYYDPGLGRFLQTDPMGLQTEGAKLTPEQKALYGAGAPEAFSTSEMNLFRYCGDDPVDRSDPTGLDAVLNADGTSYHFVVRPELSLRNLAGTQITHSNPRYTEQCATGGQFLTGTNLNGRIHDAPATRTWTQGEAVSRNTPIGTLIARGWEGGSYPNRPASDYARNEVPNHVGIYMGPGDKAGTIKVFDQSVGRNGALAVRPYPTSQGWSVVNSTGQYDKQNSNAAARAVLREDPKQR